MHNITKPEILNDSKIIPLSELISFGSGKSPRYSDQLNGYKEKAGLYAFWLSNDDSIAKNLNRSLTLFGAKNEKQKIEWNWNLKENRIPLYIGKSTNLTNRISMHLKLGTTNWYPESDNPLKDGPLSKHTTSCQFRAGLEHLLKGSTYDSFDFMNDRIGMTICTMDDVVDRFYTEDLAIGLGKPWFNVDSER